MARIDKHHVGINSAFAQVRSHTCLEAVYHVVLYEWTGHEFQTKQQFLSPVVHTCDHGGTVLPFHRYIIAELFYPAQSHTAGVGQLAHVLQTCNAIITQLCIGVSDRMLKTHMGESVQTAASFPAAQIEILLLQRKLVYIC